jgi:acetate kinase
MPDHTAAFRAIMKLIQEDRETAAVGELDYFAHRYVHPGHIFSRTTPVTNDVMEKLKQTLGLAPLHNPICFSVIQCCAAEYPEIPQYVVFDTAFHTTIPKENGAYALPQALTRKYHIRKVGFHGISHSFVMQQACEFLGRDVKTQKIISCHLGTGGSSVCAIEYGRSINNSMGFTPLEGLMMNTRSGDLDVGLVFYLMFQKGLSADEAEALLNKKSGVLGVFQSSSDLRDVVAQRGMPGSDELSLTMYVRRVKKYIGFYELLLKKADVLIFTDSLGVGVPLIRERVCAGLECFGIKCHPAANHSYVHGIVDISETNSETRILVIPTDEEIMIGREAYMVQERAG